MQINKSNIERKINIIKQSERYAQAKKDLRGKHRNTLQTDKIYELKCDIYNAVTRQIPSLGSEKLSDLIKNNTTVPDGKKSKDRRTDFYFNPDLIHRKSLYPEEHPEGAYDIIRLMHFGWKYSTKPPRGVWKGKKIVGLKKRAGSDFLKNAIYVFNRRNKPLGIRAELGKKYNKGV